MGKAKLFISHSSKNNDLARTLSDRLGAHFEILIDLEAIRGGDLWRERIDGMLLECHAAVFLMTPEARQSQWVPQEAFLLRFRRDVLQPGTSFKFVPLMVDDFDQADLARAPFGPAWLAETQALRIASADPQVGDLLAALRDVREEAKDWTDLRSIENYAAQKLDSAGPYTRQEIAPLLGFDPETVPIAASRPLWLAARLLRCGLSELIRVAATVAEFQDRTLAITLFDALAPYLWIDEDGVRPLSEVVLGADRPRRPTGLVANAQETPRHYIQRASHRIPSWRIWPCRASWGHTGVLDWLVEEIRAVAEEEVFGSEEATLAAEDAENPIVVLLPPELARLDAGLLQDLADAFKPLTFLLPCEPAPPPLEQRFPDIVSLPGPDPGHEDEMARQLRKARKALGDSQ